MGELATLQAFAYCTVRDSMSAAVRLNLLGPLMAVEVPLGDGTIGTIQLWGFRHVTSKDYVRGLNMFELSSVVQDVRVIKTL